MRDVAGARRQVDDQEVGLVPEHVGEELLERLVQHRAPPDDRLVLRGEEAHRDAAHAVGLGRHQHLVDDHRRVLDARACAGSRSPTRRRRPRPRRWPRWASATARLVVTDDLPTPPLPEAMSSTRVLLPGSAKGIARPSAWPWACWLPAVAAGSPWSLLAQRGPLVVGHHGEVEVDARRRRRAPTTAPLTRLVISLRSGQPATVRATVTSTAAAVDRDARGPCRGRRCCGAARGPRPGGGRR